MLLIERRPKESVTKEQFSEWKQHPVTKQMKLEVALSILESFDQDIPNSIDGAAAMALKQEGARAVLEEFFDWVPEGVSDE